MPSVWQKNFQILVRLNKGLNPDTYRKNTQHVVFHKCKMEYIYIITCVYKDQVIIHHFLIQIALNLWITDPFLKMYLMLVYANMKKHHNSVSI